MPERGAWNDVRMEAIVGQLLRAGVILSAAVVLAGGILFVLRHGSETPQYHTFHGEPPEFRSVPLIIAGVRGLRGRAIIQLGLLLLIATPVARVAFSVFGFARERDRLYVVITCVVLGLLLFSLFGPHA
jgi:uncharacterized membrane protein